MAESFKGTDLNDERLENIARSDIFTVDGKLAILKEIRDMAYSIGYRHGHEDKVKGK